MARLTPGVDLSRAWQGWAAVMAGFEEAADYFRPTLAGLWTALLWLLVAVLLSTAVQAALVGMPQVEHVLLGIVEQALTLALTAVAIRQTLKFLKIDVPLLELFVPLVYALAFMFVFAIPLGLLGPNVALIAVLVLGIMVWRLGHVLGGMSGPTSVAFALLCLMVLVIARYALYMVVLQLPSPA